MLKTDRANEAIQLQERVLASRERDDNPDFISTLNNHAYGLRNAGFVAEAEPFDRRVATASIKLLGEIHPLTIHRRNNLVLTLIMLCKLEEARQILAANWRLNASPQAITTPRIAFLRPLIALLESQPDTPFLGQLKTLLTGPELPVACDVAVPWDIAYFIEFLKPKLGEHPAEYLTALVAALNDRYKLSALDPFPEWRVQPPVHLDIPWP
ncbi:MAG: tetratricopeptide repeat protein [Verrucomicrobia bacterium]|nr:tetratricopeptide repeat protein [Verrucomicrobiota bacterium]